MKTREKLVEESRAIFKVLPAKYISQAKRQATSKGRVAPLDEIEEMLNNLIQQHSIQPFLAESQVYQIQALLKEISVFVQQATQKALDKLASGEWI